MNVLSLNVGSSSLKFGIYTVDSGAPQPVAEGDIGRHGEHGHLRYRHGSEEVERELAGDRDAAAMEALEKLGEVLPIDGVAHRIVHGGPWLREHCLIDETVMKQIEAAASFAPLHVPGALAWIHHATKALPHARQVACLDTAFHRDLPDTARILPLPRELLAKGVQRYGFHGLSCESILQQMVAVPERLIIAHLGSGASLTAVRNGVSVDTSMGMTPSGGIIMGTRPGDLDPGSLLFLLREGYADTRKLEDLLEHRSGLRGISDLSSDVRELGNATDHPLAALALKQFALSVAKQAAALAVVLGGVDLLVLTGGIGEHDGTIRSRIEALLAPCLPNLRTLVLPAQENRVMAAHAARLASQGQLLKN